MNLGLLLQKLSPADYAKVVQALGGDEGEEQPPRAEPPCPWEGCQKCPLFSIRGGRPPMARGTEPRTLVVEMAPDLLLNGQEAQPWLALLREALGSFALTARIKCVQPEMAPFRAYQDRCPALWWEADLAIHSPDLMVTLGEEALTALTGQGGLEGIRARRDPLEHRGIPLVATFGLEDLRADTRVGRWVEEWKSDLNRAAKMLD